MGQSGSAANFHFHLDFDRCRGTGILYRRHYIGCSMVGVDVCCRPWYSCGCPRRISRTLCVVFYNSRRHACFRLDGTCLYEHEDPRLGEHPDWGTLIFNYSRNEVRNFLVASALYWLESFHIDGLRVDAVASMLYLDYSRKEGEWIANEFGGRENLAAVRFLQEATATAYKRFPGIMMIAEESTAWTGVTKPTLCCMPPDSCSGYASEYPCRPTKSITS